MTPSHSSMRPFFRQAMRSGQVIVLAIIFFFWGQTLWSNWAELKAYDWEVRPALLAASLLVLVAHLMLLALIWWWSLRFFGQPAGLLVAVRVWLVAQIARYLPGGVWDSVGRIYLGGQEGLSRARTGVSVVAEMAAQSVAAAIVFLVSLLFWPTSLAPSSFANFQSHTDRWIFAIVGLILLGLVLLYPPVLEKVLNAGLRLLRRPVVRLPLRYRDMLSLTACHFGARWVVGFGFFLFVNAIYPLPAAMLPVAAGIFAVAWLIGFLVVFVPQGLGVREGVMTALLMTFMPLPVVTVVALGFRVWISLRDLIGAGVGLAMRRVPPSGEPRPI